MKSKNFIDEDLNKFINELKLMGEMNNINFVFYNMLPLLGFGGCVAFSRFRVFHKKMYFGAHELINSYKKEHLDFYNKKLEDSLWVRALHLENAILAYNSIRDIIYQVVYFNYHLYEEFDNVKIRCREDIINVSKNIKGKEKLNKINLWLSEQDNTKEFYNEFSKYIKFTSELRNVANDIKHMGCYVVNVLDNPRLTVVIKKIEGKDINITENCQPKLLILDEEVSKLVEIHKTSLDMQKRLYKLCNFEERLKFYKYKAN